MAQLLSSPLSKPAIVVILKRGGGWWNLEGDQRGRVRDGESQVRSAQGIIKSQGWKDMGEASFRAFVAGEKPEIPGGYDF